MKTNIIIKGNNNYSFEGSETGKSWDIEIKDKDNLLTNNIIEQLKQFDKPIYFNNTNSKYWIFDFKIEDVYFESVNIDCCNMKMILNAYH